MKISVSKEMLPGTAYIIIFALIAVFAYPFAVLPPAVSVGSWHNSYSFDFSLPGFLILALLSIGLVLNTRVELSTALWVGVGVFLICWVINIPSNSEYVDDYFRILGCLSIPLAAAVLREKNVVTVKRVALFSLVFWTFQVVHGVIAVFRKYPTVGTAGNINWMAALLLLLSPWAYEGFLIVFSRFIIDSRYRIVTALLSTILPTAFILYHCGCRAAWFSIPVVALISIAILFKTTKRRGVYLAALIGLSILAGASVTFLFPDRVQRAVSLDVRQPLWSSTVNMIKAHPFGIGTGEFQRTFPSYSSVEYHQRLYTSDTTYHPHNEVLNLVSQLGLPVLIALVIFILPIFQFADRTPLSLYARISSLFIIIMAFFDMPLVQAPVSFLGFFMIGLCWPVKLTNREPRWKLTRSAGILVGTAAAILAIYFTYYDLRYDYHYREGLTKKGFGKAVIARGNVQQGRAYFQDAKTHFESAATPFYSVQANFDAGQVAFNFLAEYEEAERLLSNVRELDPNFCHINFLMARIGIEKGDVDSANTYFFRELKLFPKNVKSWRFVYDYAFSTRQYDLCIEIQKELVRIYREKGALVFPGEEFLARKADFSASLGSDGLKLVAINYAKEFVNRIPYNKMDPVVGGIGGSFGEHDFRYWQGRYQKLKQLGALPSNDVAAITEWFCKSIRLAEQPGFEPPYMVVLKGRGNSISRYACYSEYVNLSGGQSIIQVDGYGEPEFCWVIMGKVPLKSPAKDVFSRSEMIRLDYSSVQVYKVDLTAGTSEPVALEDFREKFVWKPSQTVVYFDPIEHFDRTQILGAILSDDLPFLDVRPPSIRLIELMGIAGTSPPLGPDKLIKFCYSPGLR